MGYDIRCATEEEFDRWNRYVSRSHHAGAFHSREGLEALTSRLDARLYPLIGLKGEQVIGIFPLFRRKRGPFVMMESPPVQTVLRLGPALLDVDQLKQRKLERRNRRFVEGCLDWIERNFDADYVDIRTSERYGDLRPFKKGGYTVEPFYTHVVDISVEPDVLLKRISSDARSKIRNTDDDAYDVEIGDVDDARQIVRRVHERHGDDLEGVDLDEEFVNYLYNEFSDGAVKPYVCYDSSDRALGGILTVEHGSTVLSFMGGAKNDGDLPVNELLDWHIIQEAHERGYERYDFEGANAYGISQYKAKFAPELVPYYKALRLSPQTKVALAAREKLQPVRERMNSLQKK